MDRLAWTPRAWAYAGSSVAALVAGALEGRLYLTSLAAAVLFLLAVEAVLVGRRLPALALEVHPLRTKEAQPCSVDVRCTASAPDAQFKVALDPVFDLAGGSNLGTLEARSFQVSSRVRGPHAVGPLDVRIWSPLRLWAREHQVGQGVSVEVVPSAEDVKRFGLLSRTLKPLSGRFQVNRPGQGFDFFALRQYASGDTMRDVNWKASARQEELVVNQRQRETFSEIVVLVDARLVSAAGVPGTTPLDRSCRVALGLHMQANRSRDSIHIVAYGERVARLAKTASVHDCETLLARLPSRGASTLADAWADVRREVRGTGPVIVLSSLEADPMATRAMAEMRAQGHPVTVFSPCPAGPTWSSSRVRQRAREEALEAASALGAVVVDWQVGQGVEAQKPAAVEAFA